jgi:hypothetical protein
MTPVFFILSLVFAVSSLTFSGAISRVQIERTAAAKLADDSNAALRLEGFQNNNYNMNTKFTGFGCITNNTNKIMKLTVTITPEILWKNNKNNWFRISIGSEPADFEFNQSLPKTVVLYLIPGQTVEARAAIAPSLGPVNVSFQFSATDLNASYSVQLRDTLKTPRRITCY